MLREADRNAGMVIDAVARQRAEGDDVLLIVGSDHGHETVSGSVDVEAELIAAGLKDAAEFDRCRRAVERHGVAGLSASRSGKPPVAAGGFPAHPVVGGGGGAGTRTRDDRPGAASTRWLSRCRCGRTRRRTNTACRAVLAGGGAAMGQAGPGRLRPTRRVGALRAIAGADDRGAGVRRRHGTRRRCAHRRSGADHSAPSQAAGGGDGWASATGGRLSVVRWGRKAWRICVSRREGFFQRMTIWRATDDIEIVERSDAV